MPGVNPYGRTGWPESKRIEVVTTYLALGKAPMVEAVTGVPRATIRQWKLQPWWKELEHEIRSEATAELDSKLARIVDRSLDAVVDRLEHGDFILDSRSGTVKRIPVKLRDVHKVSIDLIDKRELLRKKEVATSDKLSIEDVIKKLADEFKNFVKVKSNQTIIEGEVVDAVYDERKEGLQEGEPSLQQSQGQGEGTDGTEQSPSDAGEETRQEHNG